MFEEAEKLGLPEPVIEKIGMRYRFTVFPAGLLDIKEHGAEAGTMSALSQHHVEILKICGNDTSISEAYMTKTVIKKHRFCPEGLLGKEFIEKV